MPILLDSDFENECNTKINILAVISENVHRYCNPINFQGTNIWSIKWYHAVLTVLVILSLTITNSVLAYRVMAADGLLGEGLC